MNEIKKVGFRNVFTTNLIKFIEVITTFIKTRQDDLIK